MKLASLKGYKMNVRTKKAEKSDFQRNLNRIKVLQLIRNEKEITRADIIKATGLSAPTITRIVDGLLKQHLIQTDGMGSSLGGRPPQLIRFCSKENYVIGIDLGATFIRSALSNLDGDFIFEIHIPTNIRKGFEGVMQQVGELIEKMTHLATKKKTFVCWGLEWLFVGWLTKIPDWWNIRLFLGGKMQMSNRHCTNLPTWMWLLEMSRI